MLLLFCAAAVAAGGGGSGGGGVGVGGGFAGAVVDAAAAVGAAADVFWIPAGGDGAASCDVFVICPAAAPMGLPAPALDILNEGDVPVEHGVCEKRCATTANEPW